MEIKKSLEKIGLTTNEITIYTYLLANGSSLGSKIHKETLIEKTASYKALAQLQRRGLVNAIGDSRNQLFQVTDKETAIKYFNEQEKELKKSKSDFLTAFDQIEKSSANYYQSENIKIFTGEDAYIYYHKEILKGSGVKQIRTLASTEVEHMLADGKEKVKNLNKWFIPERLRKNISIQVLYDKNTKPDEFDLSDKKLLKECRKYDQTMNLPSGMSIFGDRVGFNSIKNGKYWAVIINDAKIATLLDSMYDVIWNQSKVVNK